MKHYLVIQFFANHGPPVVIGDSPSEANARAIAADSAPGEEADYVIRVVKVDVPDRWEVYPPCE